MVFSFLKLIFPPICLHCREQAAALQRPLCETCIEQLSFAELDGRCPRCCASLTGRAGCCASAPHSLKRALAIFDAFGPAYSLARRHSLGRDPGLARGMVGWMALRYLELHLPEPDLVIPMPTPLAQRACSRFDPSQPLADALSRVLARPSRSLIKCAHSSLLRFQWRSSCEIAQRKILLVVDLLPPPTALVQVCQLLQEGFPESIHVIGFCG